MNAPVLAAKLEALLFVSGEPLTLARLAQATSCDIAEIKTALEELSREYAADSKRGLVIVLNGDQAEMATKSDVAPAIEGLTKSALQESLSRAAWEVLSIIAYRAPITRSEIEAIRGVNCNFTLRNLLLRNLIERKGNPEDSREYIYEPSFRLLETLGLRRPEELPDYLTLSQDPRLSALTPEEMASDDPAPGHSTP